MRALRGVDTSAVGSGATAEFGNPAAVSPGAGAQPLVSICISAYGALRLRLERPLTRPLVHTAYDGNIP
jgi:hypothetical protein